MYDWVMSARDWAYAQTEPIRARIRKLLWMLQPELSPDLPATFASASLVSESSGLNATLVSGQMDRVRRP